MSSSPVLQPVVSATTAWNEWKTWCQGMHHVVTPFGTTYAYKFVPPVHADKPVLLFLHGFPETSYDWHHQIDHFAALGYGVLAPDLLGFGQTSKPSDVYDYGLKKMCHEIICILRKNRIRAVIGVGHDLGNLLLSCLSSYHSDRFLAYVYLGGGCGSAERLDLGTAILTGDRNSLLPVGSGRFVSLAKDADAAKVMSQNTDLILSLAYKEVDDFESQKWTSSSVEASHWIGNQQYANKPSWMDAETWDVKRSILADGTLVGPICWLKMKMSSGGTVSTNSTSRPGTLADSKPVLLVEGTSLAFGPTASTDTASTAWREKVTVRYIDAGYWMMLENPRAVNIALEDFLTASS